MIYLESVKQIIWIKEKDNLRSIKTTAVCNEKPPIQLLQEVNKDYGLIPDVFNGKAESMSVINIPTNSKTGSKK